MTSSKILGYACMAAGQPLKPFYYNPPEIGNNDVRVTVTHCGLCHTDIQAVDDYYGITTYPFVPGHEIVGYVSEIGSSVSDLKIGDRVGIGWQGRSCMQCEWCLKGEEQLCMDIVDSGTWVPYGGFSSSVIADHRFAYPLPDEMSSETAAVLMCAGITVYTPLRTFSNETIQNLAGSGVGGASPHLVEKKHQPQQKLAIIGLGGLGHLAIQFAHALNYEVTVFSSSPDKEEQAMAFGADHFTLSSNRASVRQQEFTFDLMLCTATGKLLWEDLLMIMKKEGKILLAGFVDLSTNTTDLVAHNLSIIGSFLGNRVTMREMLGFAHAHHIEPVVEVMPMHEINQGMTLVKENKARYRIVMVNMPEGD